MDGEVGGGSAPAAAQPPGIFEERRKGLLATGLDLHYGAAHILRGVSLEARIGEVTCVLGRNGVGKTSLMRALTGQHPISGGSLTWQGQDLARRKPAERAAAGIAIVPQGRENLETGFAPLPRAERFVPPEVFELFPVLKSMLRRRGGDLSGGQQQQLAIGRALTMRPKALLLDEPTEGIQPSIIKDIGRAIETLRGRGDMAIVLVEQYFDFAWALADQIIVLDRGEVTISGARSALDRDKVEAAMSV